ncbi:hypothetical protein ACHHYP_11348 [Achlya hypogyna]|uniref:Uncharacterized protein n=1 Tax=Achlya hypogyna TaxID=1202772 RepID=A0A1V9ZHM8_ACHHY|nr:hypothetical protein ACHHYP_11348 [Achlya hypogyna]
MNLSDANIDHLRLGTMHRQWLATVAAAVSTVMAQASVWSPEMSLAAVPSYPSFVYPKDLDLAHAFPVALGAGKDVLLPLEPVRHYLFPEVEAPQFALGFSIATCAGSIAVALMMQDNSTRLLSAQPAQCFTFMKSPTAKSTSLCELYLDADELFYTIDPHTVQGVVLMADLGADATALVHLTSSHLFPGYVSLLQDNATLPFVMTLDSSNVTGHAEFAPPTIVEPATTVERTTCVKCTYDLYVAPISSNASVNARLPAMCLAKFPTTVPLQLVATLGSSDDSNLTATATALGSRISQSGWYSVHLVARHKHADQPVIALVYPPTKLYIATPPTPVYVYVAIVLLSLVVAVVAVQGGRRYRRYGASLGLLYTIHDHADEERVLLGTLSGHDDSIERGEFMGLLSRKASSQRVGGRVLDANDDDVLSRYDEIEGDV